MPQCDGGNWWSGTGTVPLLGKGSLHNHMISTTLRSRARACKINNSEQCRVGLYVQMLERHQRAENSRKAHVLQRVRRTLEELNAYKSVLNHKYKAEGFQTLQWGYKPTKAIKSPEIFHRCQIETKIYNLGFTKETLKPEVNQIIEDRKPEKYKNSLREKVLTISKVRSNFQIDRSITNRAMKKEARVRENEHNILAKISEEEQQREQAGMGERSNTFLTFGDSLKED